MTTDDTWGGDLPRQERDATPAPGPAGYTPALGLAGWQDAVRALGDLTEAARALDRALLHGVPYQMDALGGGHVVALLAQVQDVRRDLAGTEAAVVRLVGQDEFTAKAGTLPDGRAYEVRKGAVRKAWDHEAWQHNVRARVVEEMVGRDAVLVHSGTGEAIDPFLLLSAVQRAHGSTAPRATVLKQMGLDPGDYCEQASGPWSVTVTGGTGDDA